ncbi:MAG: hypothetical protein ACK4N5_12975, partial [Myxococcales bacterium]
MRAMPQRFMAIAVSVLLGCASEPEPAPNVPPAADLVELAPWPEPVGVRLHPSGGVEFAPAWVRGHRNRRTPSPDTLEAGTARPVSERLFAAIDPDRAAHAGTREALDLNTVGVVRVRQAGAPAPAVIAVVVPGLLAGAGSLVVLGAQVVAAAAARGVPVEVWAIDRRSNVFEDRTGIRSAADEADPERALAYYGLDGRPRAAIGGREFTPLPDGDLLFQAEWGLDTHLRDYRAVVLAARRSAARVLLGGHSVGGVQAALYAGYDFSRAGEPETLGAEDVDGIFLIDGVPAVSPDDAEAALQAHLEGGAPSDFGFPMPGLRALRTRREGDVLAATYLSAKGLLDAALLQTLAAAAVGALHAPDVLGRLTVPAPFVVSDGPKAMVGPWKALFPAALDDDLVVVPSLRFSLGFPAGAPDSLEPGVRRADPQNPFGLFAIGPTSEATPLGWLDSREVAQQPQRGEVPQYGHAEFQDVRVTAQAFAGGPTADFLEWYFPLRLLLDLQGQHEVRVTLRRELADYASYGLFNAANSYDCID